MFNRGGQSATVAGMSKKKPNDDAPKKGAGKHTTKRINMGVPEDWHAFFRQLAAKRKQPVLWVFLELGAIEGEKYGLTAPPLPWNEGE